MSKIYLDTLKKVAPGFRDDKDDPWTVYLTQQEKARLAKWRRELHLKLEYLDELRLEASGTKDEKALLDEVNAFIKNELLVSIPKLKDKGISLMNERISNDFSPVSKRPRLNDSLKGGTFRDAEEESEYLPSDFLPSAPSSIPKKSTLQSDNREAPRHRQKKKEQPIQTPVPPKSTSPQIDTYFDDVPDFCKPILERLRPQIELYKCKARVLDAIESYNRHVRMTKTIKDLKDLVKKK